MVEPIWIFTAAAAVGDADDFRSVAVVAIENLQEVACDIAIWSARDFDGELLLIRIDADRAQRNVKEYFDAFAGHAVLLVIDACARFGTHERCWRWVSAAAS